MWDKKDRRRIRLQKIGIEPTINEQPVLEFWFRGKHLPISISSFSLRLNFPFLNFVTHLERQR